MTDLDVKRPDKFVRWTVSPSDHFVVGDMMSEAAKEHADKAVAEGDGLRRRTRRGRRRAYQTPKWRCVLSRPSIHSKSAPEEVHAELRQRTEETGKSLQEYFLGRLVEEARRPSSTT
jgi:hypothetical protein